LALAEEFARRAGFAIENAQLYRAAQDANRAKDEFLATISHELRTPLTAILGWTELLRTGNPALAKRAVETIERNAKAQARIVDDVLDVSRIITGKLSLKFERINVSDAVRAAVETVRPAAEAKAIELAMKVDPRIGETIADAARLQQVAWNLLSNAIRFTPHGGRVDVELERDDARIVLRVIDTGEGIHPDFLPHVFERFQQADSTPTRKHGGLGLGLAIVRHLVELHGGEVAVHSEGPGRGATFSVTLPIGTVPPDNLDDIQSDRLRSDEPWASTPQSLAHVRVLVVEDDPDTRDFVANLLRQHSAEVTTAASSKAGLEALVQASPDVIVSDIGMPDEDGYAFIARARALMAQSGSSSPAIALTAYTQSQDRARATAAGFQAYLTKPIEANTLLAMVATLARRK
jgi:CheY-like chemotaxis protein